MRALCAVRGRAAAGEPAAEGAPRPLGAGARVLALRAPGLTQPLHFVVEAKARVRDLRAQAHRHFRLHATGDTHLFGLALFHDGEYLFVDLDSKLSKYAPKSWRSSHTHGLDGHGRPLLELHLAVQFYVESPLLLSSDAARRLYYLQLRSALLASDALPAERLLPLAGLALQAEYGDADAQTRRDYFTLAEFAPPSLTGDWVAAAVRACHRDARGLARVCAETRFIREVALLPDALDAHRYRMKRTKSEPEPGGARLLVTARGVSVASHGAPTATFVWSSIGKLSFDRKKFEIRTEDAKVTLYASSEDKAKYLFALCRETHQFSMKIANELNEVLQREVEEQRGLHAPSTVLDFQCDKNKSEQRVSVISSASSNTTSGIVSDRVHSEDELEIMIDCPPALSTESLAFAHLLDSSTSYLFGECADDKPRLNKTVSLQYTRTNTEDTVAPESPQSSSQAEQERRDASPVSGKLKCAGSQCSSSCSTVVVARAALAARRSSNASSLELGFSHTAQNSTVSEHVDYAEDAGSALYDGPVTVAASSETSGVYTMGSSETTARTSKMDTVSEASRTECGSSHYGSYKMVNDGDLTRFDSVSSIVDSIVAEHEVQLGENLMFRRQKECGATEADCVDGGNAFRQRSGSAVSALSFHGDGSDPTDNKHALLSASELSDLIVGRGVYPARQSVSDTLDSVSDYVRLPLPLSGESYLQGHEDTAPSYDNYHDAFFERPPTPPSRIDSRKLNLSLPNIVDLDEISVIGSGFPTPAKPPPPYEFNHKTFTADMSTRHSSTDLTNARVKSPPPYPGEVDADRGRYEREEVAARLVTSKPMITILKAEAGDVSAPIARTFAGPMSVEHRFQKCKRHPESSRVARVGGAESALVAMQKLPPPPPPRAARLPPPPPPPHLQQFHQQLYSDADYVVYPLQDPLLSQQNYLDSKLAALRYRSTPFLSSPAPAARSPYGSSQNLSDSYVQLPRRARDSRDEAEPPAPRLRRLPPPPPPPYEHKNKLPSHSRDSAPPAPAPAESLQAIDIKTLREKSRHLDLPLIAALCNDRSLLKQTKAFGPGRRDEPSSVTTDSVLFRCKRDSTLKRSQPTQGKKILVRNPNDKLPDLPGELHTPRAKSNTYVAHPGAPPPRA